MSDIISEIREELLTCTEIKYKEFQGSLIPTVEADKVLGIRTPALRKMAKKYYSHEQKDVFLGDLPHDYFEENQLHAFIISLERDFDVCIAEVEKFLPYVDNWATSDQLLPKVFKKSPERLLPHIDKWIASGETYKMRFAIGLLMQHFLNEKFEVKYLEKVAEIRSQEYYVNMMIAWYFATALAKQFDATLPFIENTRLAKWTHNKTIQKAIESYRIMPEQKVFLRTLKY